VQPVCGSTQAAQRLGQGRRPLPHGRGRQAGGCYARCGLTRVAAPVTAHEVASGGRGCRAAGGGSRQADSRCQLPVKPAGSLRQWGTAACSNDSLCQHPPPDKHGTPGCAQQRLSLVVSQTKVAIFPAVSCSLRRGLTVQESSSKRGQNPMRDAPPPPARASAQPGPHPLRHRRLRARRQPCAPATPWPLASEDQGIYKPGERRL